MKKDILLIALTENSWLYMGLSALLPEMTCIQMDFSTQLLPQDVNVASRIIIAVDSLILFRGKWDTLNALRASRPDVSVVWLTWEHTGRAFPVENKGNLILDQKQNITTLRCAMRRVAKRSDVNHRDDDHVDVVKLTLTERYLLPRFMSGMSLSTLSLLTGSPIKSLYTHRQKIMAKTGFRKVVFLQYVYARNYGLRNVSDMKPWYKYSI